METPSLEEVREYFKDAAVVKCIYSGITEDITKNKPDDIYLDRGSYWIKIAHPNKYRIKLWDEDRGYAKIISYKEKTYQITEGQIKEVEKEGVHKLKEYFPEVFKPVLEVGRWYKRKDKCVDWLMCYTGDGLGYGFNISKKFGIDYVMGSEKWKEATEEEVEQALTREAENKYKLPCKIKYIDGESKKLLGYSLRLKGNTLYASGSGDTNLRNIIFKDGKWAEIVKQEPVELSLQEIADKFEIDVEQLKIKK